MPQSFVKVKEFATSEIDSGFGRAIQVLDDEVLIGAPLFDLGRGQVYKFDRLSGKLKGTHEGTKFHASYGSTIGSNSLIGDNSRKIITDGTHTATLDVDNRKLTLDNKLAISADLAATSRYFCATWNGTTCELCVHGFVLFRWKEQPIWKCKLDRKPNIIAMNDSYIFVVYSNSIVVYKNVRDCIWDVHTTLDVDALCTSVSRDWLFIGASNCVVLVSLNTFTIQTMPLYHPCLAIQCFDETSFFIGMPDANNGCGVVHEYKIIESNVLREALMAL